MLVAACGHPAYLPRGISVAGVPCPRGFLPAYAHNDYQNRKPLFDALALGYRGVEVDVFLVDGVLRVGHDRRLAEQGASLEALYLDPLRSLVSRCGPLTVDSAAFLLNVEVKEESPATHQALASRLRQYELHLRKGEGGSPVEVVLVGWHPPATDPSVGEPFGLQHRIPGGGDQIPEGLSSAVRLISVDFGRTAGPLWRNPFARAGWLSDLRRVKTAFPGRLLRVHNVPVDSAVYASLLAAGVDLIGIEDLPAGRRMLDRIGVKPGMH